MALCLQRFSRPRPSVSQTSRRRLKPTQQPTHPITRRAVMQAPDAQRREKKRKRVYAKRKCAVEVHPRNVVLFKRCLREKEQIRMVESCARLAKKGGNERLLPRKAYQSKEKKAKPILFYNWPAVPESFTNDATPDDLLELGERLFKKGLKAVQKHRKLNPSEVDNRYSDFPTEYSPDALYGVLYPHGGSFIPHVDGAKGWVLAISMGDTARFFVCDTADSPRYYLTVESGDAIIFKGGTLYHGVEAILPGTAPSFWKDESQCEFAVYNMARFNLQYRDPVRDRLTYYPHFVAISPNGEH